MFGCDDPTGFNNLKCYRRFFITTNKALLATKSPIERAFLVGVERKQPSTQNGTQFLIEDSLDELAALADTAGLQVEGGTYQRLYKINPNTLIGSGKVEELVAYRDELAVDVFLFDDELSPRQQRELEKSLQVKVIDRTALILDIFARHASTREGQLQVELAQYEYRLPRLTRMWTHLARQAGGRAGGASGGVGVRGPGETQLEVDRREINHRIAHLKRELVKVRQHRERHRKQRQQTGIPIVAMVGYTNAGKSTLLNQLTNAQVLAADKLFATLDPTTRRVDLPNGGEVLLSDTVGFIQKLPTNLVAAFRATLEGIKEADLILHVVDVTHPNATEQAAVVAETLEDIEAVRAPVLTVLNKIDRLDEPEEAIDQLTEYDNNVAVSAVTGQGIEALLNKFAEIFATNRQSMDLLIPYQRGDLISLLHEKALINQETHSAEGACLQVQVPHNLVYLMQPYQLN